MVSTYASGLLLAVLAVAYGAPQGYTAISNDVCPAGSPANILHQLPRYDRSAQSISSDLGSYNILDCQNSVSDSLDCRFNNPFDNSDWRTSKGAPDSILQWAEGPVLYGALAVVMSVLVVLMIILFIIGRYCCACCPRASCCCACLQCGALEPTGRMCGCGAVESLKGVVSHEYPVREKRMTLALLLVFLVLVGCFTIIGSVKGMLAFPQAAKDMPLTLTNTYVPFINDMKAHAIQLVQNMAADVVVPAMYQFNETLQSGLRFQQVDAGLSCIVRGIDTLPDTTEVLQAIDNLNASIISIKPNVNSLLGNVLQVLDGKDNMTIAVNTLSALVGSLSLSLWNASRALDATNSSIMPLYATKASLVGTGGILPTLHDALFRLQPNEGLPNATQVNDTAGPADIADTSAYGSLTNLINAHMNGSPPEITSLVGHLLDINSTMHPLASVNFSKVADTVIQLNDVSAQMMEIHVPGLLAAINQVSAVLHDLPTSQAFTAPINNILSTTGNIPFSAIIATLNVLDAAVAGLPNITDAIGLLDRIRTAADIVPCGESLAAEVRHFNATLVQLPSSLSSVLDQITSINATVQDAISQIDDAKAQLLDAEQKIDEIDLNEYITQVNDAWGSVNSTVRDFNVTSVLSRIALLDTLTINFTDITTTIKQVNQTLAAAVIADSMITDLRSFETNKSLLLTGIEVAINDYNKLAMGYCSGDPAQLCSDDADCAAAAAAPCLANGVYRCESDPTAVCSQDADCQAGDRCLADLVRAATLKGQLTATVADAPLVDTTLQQISDASSSANSLDLSTSTDNIVSANASIMSVDTSEISQNLQTINGSISAFDAQTVRNQVDDLQGVLNSFSLDDFGPQIEQLNSTIADIKGDKRDMVAGIQALLSAFTNILNVGIHEYATRLSLPNLELAEAVNGTGGVLRAILSVAQDAYDELADVQQTVVSLPSMDIVGVVPIDTVDKFTASGATYGSRLHYGAIYYVMKLMGSVDTIDGSDPDADTVFLDKDGNKYPNNLLCLTDACITTTVDYYSSSSLAKLSDNAIPLSINGLSLINLFWLLPAVVVLFGICGLAGRRVCSNPRWQKCPYGCMTGCIFFQLPIFFLLAALLFPASMMLGDVCASGKNVGYSVILSAGDSLCDTIGGQGTLQNCEFGANIALPSGADFTVDANINLPAYYASLLTGSGTCGAVSPWSSVVNSVLQQLRTVPYQEVSSFLNDPSNALQNAGILLRPPITQLLYSNVNASANTIADVMDNIASSTLSCGNLHHVIDATLGAPCCTFMAPLYWTASTMFLIAWLYCLCGLPAGLLGRKRLVVHPWGSLVRETNSCCCGGCCGRYVVPKPLRSHSQMEHIGQLHSLDGVIPGDAPNVTFRKRGNQGAAPGSPLRLDVDAHSFVNPGAKPNSPSPVGIELPPMAYPPFATAPTPVYQNFPPAMGPPRVTLPSFPMQPPPANAPMPTMPTVPTMPPPRPLPELPFNSPSKL